MASEFQAGSSRTCAQCLELKAIEPRTPKMVTRYPLRASARHTCTAKLPARLSRTNAFRIYIPDQQKYTQTNSFGHNMWGAFPAQFTCKFCTVTDSKYTQY